MCIPLDAHAPGAAHRTGRPRCDAPSGGDDTAPPPGAPGVTPLRPDVAVPSMQGYHGKARRPAPLWVWSRYRGAGQRMDPARPLSGGNQATSRAGSLVSPAIMVSDRRKGAPPVPGVCQRPQERGDRPEDHSSAVLNDARQSRISHQAGTVTPCPAKGTRSEYRVQAASATGRHGREDDSTS